MRFPGRRRTIERLVEEQYAALYRYAYRLSGNRTDAEDLTQEAFCRAQNCLGQLREPEKAKAWLFRILRNCYLLRMRERKNLGLDQVEEIADAIAETAGEVDADQLQRALAELPEGFRTPLILFYFEEFSYREIAEQLDAPIGTVMSRLARAKAHLRSRLLGPTAATALLERRNGDGM